MRRARWLFVGLLAACQPEPAPEAEPAPTPPAREPAAPSLDARAEALAASNLAGLHPPLARSWAAGDVSALELALDGSEALVGTTDGHVSAWVLPEAWMVGHWDGPPVEDNGPVVGLGIWWGHPWAVWWLGEDLLLVQLSPERVGGRIALPGVEVERVVFPREAEHLLVVEEGGGLLRWHPSEGSVVALDGAPGFQLGVASKDGERGLGLLPAGSELLAELRLAGGERQRTWSLPEPYPRARLSADGAVALLEEPAGGLLWWRAGLESSSAVTAGEREPGRPLALSLDGRAALAPLDDSHLGLWHLDRPPVLRAWEGQGPVVDLGVSERGDLLLVGREGERVELWDLPSGTLLVSADISRAGLPERSAVTAALSPTGDLRAVIGADGVLELQDGASLQPLGRLERHDGPGTALVFSPDGRWLVTGGADGRVVPWEIERPREQAVLGTRLDRMLRVKASSNDALLARAELAARAGRWTKVADLLAAAEGAGAAVPPVDRVRALALAGREQAARELLVSVLPKLRDDPALAAWATRLGANVGLQGAVGAAP